jgi:bacteriocin-like protein
MEEVLRELSDTELDAVSGGAAAAAASSIDSNALAAANSTGPTMITAGFVTAVFLGAGGSAIAVASN